MAVMRCRVTGPKDGFDILLLALHGLDGVQSAEEVADLMPHLDDDDSSSAGLTDDMAGSEFHALMVEVSSPYADAVRKVADETAARQGLVLEYVNEF